ncbi:MAG: hypothetical protein ACLP9S_00975 [Syntrophales bacterium]|jgi:hypothetical protein
MIRKIAERLAKTKYIREAMEDQTDMKVIWKRPTPRMIIGLALVGFSYIIGWPAVMALGILAVHSREPMIIVLCGPITYGFSHLVFLAGAWLAGAQYARTLIKYATKVLFRKILRHGTETYSV